MTAREFGADYNRVAGVDGRFRLGQTHRVSFLAAGSETQDAELGRVSGPAFEADFARQGRNLSYNASYSSIDPEFETLTGFLPRVDLRQASATAGYRWWPESTLTTWGPSVTYLRLYDHAGVLQDEQLQGTASFSFRNNILLTGMINRDLERFQQVDFRKTGYGFFGVISARAVSLWGGYNWGDGVLYDEFNPYVGRSKMGNINVRLQATSRLRTDLTTVLSDFVNPPGQHGSVRCKDFPQPDDLSVHRPPTAPSHHGAQYPGRHAREQHPHDLSHQRRNGRVSGATTTVSSGATRSRTRCCRPWTCNEPTGPSLASSPTCSDTDPAARNCRRTPSGSL